MTSKTFRLFFFNDTATTEIYTLSLHDALPISPDRADPVHVALDVVAAEGVAGAQRGLEGQDRKSTRLNSSHGYISYAVFCLKKKKRLQASSISPNFSHDLSTVFPYYNTTSSSH